jgi:hypothetical protein
VTTGVELSAPGEAFAQAPHYLLDTRLMIAWARALAEAGELDKARHLAQRLREFHNPQADDFFAPCDVADDAAAPKPFQCEPPARVPAWREFVR